MTTLKITHNAGFFSCCSKRLEGIVWFFNTYKKLPDRIDSTEQFSFYKSDFSNDPAELYFDENGTDIAYGHIVDFHNDMQFLPYCEIGIGALQPFIKKYFSPNAMVRQAIEEYEKKYAIDYVNTCAVYYRGNDKSIETAIAPYDLFIAKAREIKREYHGVTFLVQSDEAEFMDAFMIEFPGSISFDEISPMRKQNSFVAAELAATDQISHGMYFFASIIVLSRCKFVITHSGNGGLWCMLYRGNTSNTFQWLNGSWNNTGTSIASLWQRNKKYIKRLLRKPLGWIVLEFR